MRPRSGFDGSEPRHGRRRSLARWRAQRRAIGEELNRLRPEFVLMHDHGLALETSITWSVATGVYMIETKRHRDEEDDLRKARGRAPAIGDQLGVWVTP